MKETKDYTLNIRMSAEDRRKLHHVAGLWHRSPSEVIRLLIATVDEEARPVVFLQKPTKPQDDAL